MLVVHWVRKVMPDFLPPFPIMMAKALFQHLVLCQAFTKARIEDQAQRSQMPAVFQWTQRWGWFRSLHHYIHLYLRSQKRNRLLSQCVRTDPLICDSIYHLACLCKAYVLFMGVLLKQKEGIGISSINTKRPWLNLHCMQFGGGSADAWLYYTSRIQLTVTLLFPNNAHFLKWEVPELPYV